MGMQSKIRGFSELIDLNVSLWAEMDLQLILPGKQNLLSKNVRLWAEIYLQLILPCLGNESRVQLMTSSFSSIIQCL